MGGSSHDVIFIDTADAWRSALRHISLSLEKHILLYHEAQIDTDGSTKGSRGFSVDYYLNNKLHSDSDCLLKVVPPALAINYTTPETSRNDFRSALLTVTTHEASYVFNLNHQRSLALTTKVLLCKRAMRYFGLKSNEAAPNQEENFHFDESGDETLLDEVREFFEVSLITLFVSRFILKVDFDCRHFARDMYDIFGLRDVGGIYDAQVLASLLNLGTSTTRTNAGGKSKEKTHNIKRSGSDYLCGLNVVESFLRSSVSLEERTWVGVYRTSTKPVENAASKTFLLLKMVQEWDADSRGDLGIRGNVLELSQKRAADAIAKIGFRDLRNSNRTPPSTRDFCLPSKSCSSEKDSNKSSNLSRSYIKTNSLSSAHLPALVDDWDACESGWSDDGNVDDTLDYHHDLSGAYDEPTNDYHYDYELNSEAEDQAQSDRDEDSEIARKELELLAALERDNDVDDRDVESIVADIMKV